MQCLVSDNDPCCAASEADDPPCWPLSPQPETARFVSNLEPHDSMSHDVKIPATKSRVVHRGAEKQPLAKVLLSRRPPCLQSFSEIIRSYLLELACVVESLQSHSPAWESTAHSFSSTTYKAFLLQASKLMVLLHWSPCALLAKPKFKKRQTARYFLGSLQNQFEFVVVLKVQKSLSSQKHSFCTQDTATVQLTTNG